MSSATRRYGLLFLIAVGSIAAVLLAGVVMGSTDGRRFIDYRQPHRETSGQPKAADISFIDSPSPTCLRPNPGSGACTIQWEYLAVTAAPGAYVISMTVAIEGQLRSYHGGFFQTSMVIPGDMTGPGYKVVCGFPNAGSEPGLGNSYTYALNARDSAGLKASNTGTISCPADPTYAYVPIVQK
jgi:hypothetical protein